MQEEGTDAFAPVVFLESPPPPVDGNTNVQKVLKSLSEEDAKNMQGEIQRMKQTLVGTNAQLERAKKEENFLEADRLKRSYEQIQSAIPMMEKQLSTGIENNKRMRFQTLIRRNDELSAVIVKKNSMEKR